MILCAVYAEEFRSLAGTAEDVGDEVYSAWYKISVTVAIVSVVHVLLAFTLLYSVCKVSQPSSQKPGVLQGAQSGKDGCPG